MLLAIGVLIGVVLGLTGAGGSVFAVPLLMLLGGLSFSESTAISLGTVALATAYGTLRNSRRGPMLWRPALLLGAAGMLTAPLGKWLANQLPAAWVLMGFSVLALVIAWRMWRSATHMPEAASVVRGSNLALTLPPDLLCRLSQSGRFEMRPRCLSALLAGGALVGVLSGLFGVGGGFLIVPLLLALSPISMAQAVNASLLIITLVSGVGFASHSLQGGLPALNLLFQVGVGGIVGMFIGQLSSRFIAGPMLQKIFAGCLLITAIVLQLFTH